MKGYVPWALKISIINHAVYKMRNEKKIVQKIEIGDLVKKTSFSNDINRKGYVIRKPDESRSVILWENTKTHVYEFDKNLMVIQKNHEIENNKGKYCVIVFGQISAPLFFEIYSEAEEEAKRILIKENKPTYVMKTVSIIEHGKIKITKQ